MDEANTHVKVAGLCLPRKQKMDVLALFKTLATWQPSVMRHFFTRLRDIFLYTLNIVFQQRMANADMASPVDSTAPCEPVQTRRRQMTSLKTKEECRLGNETITVWTVELPRKHAEGVLRYAPFTNRCKSTC